MNKEHHSLNVGDVLRQVISDRMVPDAVGKLMKQHTGLTRDRLRDAGMDTKGIIDGIGLNGWSSDSRLKTELSDRASRVLAEHAGAISTEGAVRCLEEDRGFSGLILKDVIRDLLVKRGLIDPSEVIDVNPDNLVNE
jgi:hypothetical protein